MKFCALSVAGLIAFCTANVLGGLTTVNFASDYSQHHLTQFDGVATYDSDSGKLTIAVNNTSIASHGGFLTGLALSAQGPSLSLTGISNGFVDARNHNGIVNSGPLGKYHAGASTGGGWAAGKSATQGIAAGSSRVFTFETTASDAGSLTVDDFLTQGKRGEAIVARFGKLRHHGSDRGGAVMNGPVAQLLASQFDPIHEVGLLPQDGIAPSAGPSIAATVTAVPLPPAASMAVVIILVSVALRKTLALAHVC